MKNHYAILFQDTALRHLSAALLNQDFFKHLFIVASNREGNSRLSQLYAGYSKITFLPKQLKPSDFVLYNFSKGDEIYYFDSLVDLNHEALALKEAIGEALKNKGIVSKLWSRDIVLNAPKAPPLIVTAANKNFKAWLEQLMRSLARLNYPVNIYDLGDLGTGFQYVHEVPSRAWHRPNIILDSLKRNPTFTIYLDTDICILRPINKALDDFDIGVTVRGNSVIQGKVKTALFTYGGYINAGVLFVNSTPATVAFLEEWRDLCKTLGDDQMALNQMINPLHSSLSPGSSFLRNKCRIRTFPENLYS